MSGNNPCHLPATEAGLEEPMRSVKPAMASESMLDLGRYHLAALAQSEGTKALASAFQPVQDALRVAATARVEAEQAMTDLRVDLE